VRVSAKLNVHWLLMLRLRSTQREVLEKKSHGAEVHRGIKTQYMTVSSQQAHSEKVFCCGHDPSGSIETWNALLSLGFSYTRSSPMDYGSLHQERNSVKTILYFGRAALANQNNRRRETAAGAKLNSFFLNSL
jgi:hypothetical protein